MKKLATITGITFALPFVAFAQQGTLAPIQGLLVSVGNLVSLAIPILIGVVLLYLIWVVIQYIKKPEREAYMKVIAGVIGLAVIVSIWGLVHLLQNAVLGGSSPNSIQAPHFPTN